MQITGLRIQRFKRVKDVTIDLHDINVLVGGNNSGKSSVLQGIHFFVIAAIAQREAGRTTFPQDVLLFCPARDFVTLRHGAGFKNQSNFAWLSIKGEEDGNEEDYTVRIYRGRNLGNVGCERKGSAGLGALIASSEDLFSVYVPGLAGVPRAEEFRAEAVVRRGVASGDANLYLRNVLFLIRERGRIDDFVRWVQTVFPGFDIKISFDQSRDVNLAVHVSIDGSGGRHFPFELAGTGLLQVLQIFSYVTLFGPSLLLLDEPDAHLHPDNQTVLATALQTVAEETDTRILISTHSRHLVDALSGLAHFVWMKNGQVAEQGQELERVSLLMDLGALDSFDRLREGDIDLLILTEDADMAPLKTLCRANAMDGAQTLFWSYKSASRIASAEDLARFVGDVAPATRVLIHRDRDFMTDEELEAVRQSVEAAGARLFVTRASDVESYFCDPSHCAELLEEEAENVEQWIEELAEEKHNAFVRSFLRKRDDVKFQLYKGRRDEAPSSEQMMGDGIPLPPELRLGKALLGAIRGSMYERWGQQVDLISATGALADEELRRHLAMD